MIKSPKIKIEASPNVSVTWSWFDQSQGIVQWTFQNNADTTKSVVLLRGAVDQNGQVLTNYYFGNAYWPDYLSLGITKWQRDNAPLQDQGVQNNTPPIAPIQTHGKYLVAFVFTLPAKMTWSMLEGGFGNGIQPYNPIAVEAEYVGDQGFCVGYDNAQIVDYVLQTGIPVTGPQPNPRLLRASAYKINGPFIELFNDTVVRGVCPELHWWRRVENLLKSLF
ncbi:hypothetical protein D878_gp32 [Sulfolobales Mexican rudivirus 1]|uniref:Uncharacterized protein n=1 Tax=Sulfolobales Mexican rod-shaped virus 1 TaxID=2848122 RepID=K4NWW5_9VIRU|nr:hypothetical protein D878_gp32 [Sulfolobales Mexican rudivirus 1]AFV51259.1 hypothetical protein [Sulfolobales Mexican rod-shaped virus 1]